MGWEKSTDVLDEIETNAEYDGYFCTDNCCSWELEKQNLKRNRAVTGVLDGKTIRAPPQKCRNMKARFTS